MLENGPPLKKSCYIYDDNEPENKALQKSQQDFMAEKQILDSWKEITAYLGRSEKTCQRLEKELGLPIHRLEDSPKARVFAYKDEIDRWIEKAQLGVKIELRSYINDSASQYFGHQF